METNISYSHIFCCLEEIITYLKSIHYSDEHIDAIKHAQRAILSLELLNLSKNEINSN